MSVVLAPAVFVATLGALGAAAWRVFPAQCAATALKRRALYGIVGLCLLLFAKSYGSTSAISLSILGACLCVCAATDRESGYIPDAVTYPALAGEILGAAFDGRWEYAVQGAIACGAVIALLYALTRGRGIGLGDLKLASCIGAGLGTAAGLGALGCAFATGATHAGILLALRRIGPKDAVPFAPYLAAGCVPAVFWQGAPWR